MIYHSNSWLYRMRPSVCHEPFVPHSQPTLTRSYSPSTSSHASASEVAQITPNQLRWSPFDIPSATTTTTSASGSSAPTSTSTPTKEVDFVDGLASICGAGDPAMRHGLGIHIYAANVDMKNRAFQNSDGDFLLGRSLLAAGGWFPSDDLTHYRKSHSRAAWTSRPRWVD